MKNFWPQIILLAGALLLPGCATYNRHGLDEPQVQAIEDNFGLKKYSLTPEAEDKILALDPEHITESDIRETLAGAPAPRIVNIHGGIYPVHERLISFSQFLIGMGYPETSIRLPNDGTWTFSCYEDADLIAGMIAWFYEKEGLRPMIVGHSQGGMQAVKVLDHLANDSQLHVWNPLTWQREDRYEIRDPLTGNLRPVMGLKLSYVTSMGAGGLTRILPNQWDMYFRLHTIPDTCEEFTGFYKGRDLFGADLMGYSTMNEFHASGSARVRNIELPAPWKHGSVPDTKHLLKNRAILERINAYSPPPDASFSIPANDDTLNEETLYYPWAQDVWFSIKKHWVIELQNLIRARRALHQ